ncbi:MAG TPA: MacB family efflux pump subunit [Polyangiales bacterium]|nr:MacB family efflux pump subunit [Polyangiales bacterium]
MSLDVATPRERVVPLIELQNVTRTYAGTSAPVTVLHDVSLSIHAGEFVAIMGASGSGKSTLMNILGCLDRPTAGSYRFAGREVSAATPEELALLRRETFGFVFQQYHLVAGLTAAENIEIPAVYRGLSTLQRRARSTELLASLGLAQRGDHRPDQLSGGQQQRVSIARALMNGGRVLLADEPTGALDRTSGIEVMNLLQQLSAAGHTVILVTHDRAIANEARRTIEISDGRIVADTGRDERAVLQLPSHRENTPRTALTGDAREAVRAAFRALRVNIVRTLLTLLGVVVGVASVVALLAVGEGTTRAVLAQLAAFGTHRLYVSPVGEDSRSLTGMLTEADAKIIATVPRVAATMPYLANKVTVRAGNVDRKTVGVGVTTAFPRILNWQPESGAFFEDSDERSLATVALLGKKLATALFPDGEDPIRKFVLVDNVPFQVIGVLSPKGALTGDSDDDDAIVMPFSTASQRIFGTPYVNWISVAMEDSEHSDETVEAITATLSEARRAKDFTVYNQAASVQAETATINIMTSLLTMTAIISLLVGGIGVMNIMLMTVTERTSEIGIRIAVGASRSDVLAQFLTEAVVLASLGGVLGLGVGWAVGLLSSMLEAKVVFTAPASILAFCCAVATGLLSGLLPARRAARMDPVVALARQ